MRNYKPFLLFCAYTTIFCWVCFGVSSISLWTEIVSDNRSDTGFLPVNMVLLAVLAGILGLVLTGFTAWHVSLAWRGQTTIECLEKTRYLSPLRKSMQRAQYGVNDDNEGVVQKYGQQLAQIHANALPGVTRFEEGEERPSPVGDLEQGLTAQEALHMSYDDAERARERQRYEEYLDEQDSESLPNAFDLGWKRNLLHLFGGHPLLWILPICNTLGDGWHWEPSPKWLEARDGVRRDREVQWKEQEEREIQAGWGRGQSLADPQTKSAHERRYLNTPKDLGTESRSPGKADRVLGRLPSQYADGGFEVDARPGSGMSMRTLRRKASFDHSDDDVDNYELSSDEEDHRGATRNVGGRAVQGDRMRPAQNQQVGDEWREWK